MKTLLVSRDPGILLALLASHACAHGSLVPRHLSRVRSLQVLLASVGFLLFFYRLPDRRPGEDPDSMRAPCHGTVQEVRDLGDRTQVVVFLSPLDVHVQTSPVSGTVTSCAHKAGFINAPAFLSAEKTEANERAEVLFRASNGRSVLVTQVAGLVARRILVWKSAGDAVREQEPYGMIRFGSQVRITYRKDEYRTLVSVGDRVAGPRTDLASCI